jgi:hypothetical protein
MAIIATVGQGRAQEGREAGSQAALQALTAASRNPTVLGIVFSSYSYSIQEVVAGVASQLGNTPLVGCSTTAEISSGGVADHTVVVLLLAGDRLQARSGWSPGEDQSTPGQIDLDHAMKQVLDSIDPDWNHGALIVTAEGLRDDASPVVELISHQRGIGDACPIIGCLAGGSLRTLHTYQVGGAIAGECGVAAAWLGGDIAISAEAGHGWRPVGKIFEVTRCSGNIIQELDGIPAFNAYANIFKLKPESWTLPPYYELIRLYPLGIDCSGIGVLNSSSNLKIVTPQRTETEGGLRINAALPIGCRAHLLVGNVTECLASARSAVRDAMQTLSNLSNVQRPAVAIVLVDESWRLLLEGQVGNIINVIFQEINDRIPVVGGFTFGQIISRQSGLVEILNQHFEIILLATTH